jgi:hypothetical protein
MASLGKPGLIYGKFYNFLDVASYLLTPKISSFFYQFLYFLTYLEESISLPKKGMRT